jgi:methyl-accepting chemotaxis protein
MVAVVVGTILNLINQGDRLYAGEAPDWVKLTLTFAVPFLAASFGAWSALASRAD